MHVVQRNRKAVAGKLQGISTIIRGQRQHKLAGCMFVLHNMLLEHVVKNAIAQSFKHDIDVSAVAVARMDKRVRSDRVGVDENIHDVLNSGLACANSRRVQCGCVNQRAQHKTLLHQGLYGHGAGWIFNY